MSDEPKSGEAVAEPTEPVVTEATKPANDSKPAAQSKPEGGQNWESAYKGLQKKYDKLFQEHTETLGTVDELNATIEELKLGVRTANTEKDQIATKHVETTEKSDGLQAQLNTANQTIERQKLIMSEYQDLAPFEAKGLLPSAQTQEEMKSVFDSFRETLGSQVDTATEDKVKGVGPGQTEEQTPQPLNADQIYDRMQALAGTNDPEERREWQQLNDQWMELSEAE
jgi:chromosome segregation ATPase